ncbi:NAD(P)H quinone oxidoreductase, PIG3 family [Crenothrix polyspora]|uniref:NAD(P)H quinone oxidoreductase, PIG3 family n=1 Tax=Crenothrix polyspora TaxID=360316 RepID=A0A1R4H1A5_9GAMM|nr:NAD(P)H quinone oxidoreductase, PIG3 family [Crenothrix polyspora]
MQIPTDMLAIEIIDSALQPTTRPTPKPVAHQALIKVAAAGVNRPDVMQRKGLYPPPVGASDIPGLEVAGIVVAIGECVSHVKTGDAVCALVTSGGYAQYCLANENLCLPIPKNLAFIEAAGIPETFFTVWSNVFDRAQLAANEWLLVHGGSSGIGTTAIQLAKAFGAKVIITAGSELKCQFCTGLGADAAINYQTQDFVEDIKQLTDNQGVDVILDMVGGDYLPRNLSCMAFDARLVQIALQKGAKSDINLLPIMLKRLTLTGSTLRARDDNFKAVIADKLRNQVWPLLEAETIKPVIHSSFVLTEAMQAHQLMESSQHIGKIILTV